MQVSTTPSSTASASRLCGTLRKRGNTPTAVDFLKFAKAAAGFDTKRKARGTLQNARFIFTPRVIDELLSAAEFIATANRNHTHNTILERFGHISQHLSTPANSCTPVQLPTGTSVQRLENSRIEAVAKVAHALMRQGAAEDHTMWVRFALDESKVSYAVTMD